MKILVVCQHYWPEPYPLSDVLEGLAQRGHEVHVVTDIPNYPMGHIYDGYRWGKGRKQERNGVRIIRTWTVGRRNNILFRLINYCSYALSSTLYALRTREEYDVVFAYQTSPVMMASAGLAYAKKWGKRCVLYCLDLWPASLAAGGVGENSAIYRFFEVQSRRIYRRADRILIASGMFRGYLKDKFGIPDGHIHDLPQSANAQFGAEPLQKPGDDGHIDLVFAGNIGAAQSVSTILRAAHILRDDPRFRWHILGDGSELKNLRALADELKLERVIFYGRRPTEEMPEFYARADAMLITLITDPNISLTLPSKMQSYMAAGKPILGAADGEISLVIGESQCGFCAKSEDAEGLAEVVRRFAACENRAELGNNARAYYMTHFSRDMFMDELERELYGQKTN